jgi:hypothetical protein
VAIADGFQSDGGAFGELRKEGLYGTREVVNPHPIYYLAVWAANGEEGKVLVRVAAELIIRIEHLAPPVHCLGRG